MLGQAEYPSVAVAHPGLVLCGTPAQGTLGTLLGDHLPIYARYGP